MSENNYPTSEHLKAPEGYEDQNKMTGVRTALLITELMKGADLDAAVATMTAGSAGHSAEMVANLAHLRSQLSESWLENVRSSVDDKGKDALERFESAIGERITERLDDHSKKAEKRRLGYHAELTTELMELMNESELTEDSDEKADNDKYIAYTHRNLRALFESKIIQPEPIVFVTGYKSYHTKAVMVDHIDGSFVRDNDLLGEAIEQAATTKSGYDESCADALDGLLPNKMALTVTAEGTVTIDIDGTTLDIAIS